MPDPMDCFSAEVYIIKQREFCGIPLGKKRVSQEKYNSKNIPDYLRGYAQSFTQPSEHGRFEKGKALCLGLIERCDIFLNDENTIAIGAKLILNPSGESKTKKTYKFERARF
jgi:hypothetical protein